MKDLIHILTVLDTKEVINVKSMIQWFNVKQKSAEEVLDQLILLPSATDVGSSKILATAYCKIYDKEIRDILINMVLFDECTLRNVYYSLGVFISEDYGVTYILNMDLELLAHHVKVIAYLLFFWSYIENPSFNTEKQTHWDKQLHRVSVDAALKKVKDCPTNCAVVMFNSNISVLVNDYDELVEFLNREVVHISRTVIVVSTIPLTYKQVNELFDTKLKISVVFSIAAHDTGFGNDSEKPKVELEYVAEGPIQQFKIKSS